MFDSLRDKFSKVQDGISASFRGLTLGEPVPPRIGKPDVHSGAELLAKYQTQWEEIHKMTESNAWLAQKIDTDIGHLHSDVSRQHHLTSILIKELSSLDKLIKSTETVVNQIGDLRTKIECIENDLLNLEDLIEKDELRIKKEITKKQLEEYKEEKMLEYDLIKETLHNMHQEKMKKKEDDVVLEMQAKRDLYDKKFKHDLEQYKRTGMLPHSDDTSERSLRLEEVVLDDTSEDLEKMLCEETSENFCGQLTEIQKAETLNNHLST